jgi:hypothetical protein
MCTIGLPCPCPLCLLQLQCRFMYFCLCFLGIPMVRPSRIKSRLGRANQSWNSLGVSCVMLGRHSFLMCSVSTINVSSFQRCVVLVWVGIPCRASPLLSFALGVETHYVAQLAINSGSSCLSLLSAGITGVKYHIQL